MAFAKLYTSKHAITSADNLNDWKLPFFDEHGIPMLRVLPDRGTEFNGKLDYQEYEPYLNRGGYRAQ